MSTLKFLTTESPPLIPKPSRYRRNLISRIEREADRKAAERLELDKLETARRKQQV